MQVLPQTLLIYESPAGERPFVDWFERLKDRKTKQLIDVRIARLTNGNFGDAKPVGDGVHELRIDHGLGYRLYFAREGNTVVILLLGGDKSTQSADIKKAKAYFKDYRS